MALIDKLTAIADAVRGKTGGTEGLTLDQMVTQIGQIETGGPLQAKTVNPSHAEQIITPDEGYYALDAVTVKGDENLTAENIKFGVEIFGVVGSNTGGGSMFATAVRGELPVIYASCIRTSFAIQFETNAV